MRNDPAALPKYIQVSEMLIREIAAGRLMDGDRLPPERTMASGFGIAVGTLRKALSDLESKGLLDRIQGSGNYVRHASGTSSIYALFRLELVEGGGLPTADVLDLVHQDKPAWLPEFGRSDTAHRIRRLRYLSGTPVALEEIWLDAHWAPELNQDMLSESLYLTYRNSLGLGIARAEDRVGVGQLPDWGEGMKIAPGAHCGLVDRLGLTADDETAEFSRTWFDASRCRYVCRMK